MRLDAHTLRDLDLLHPVESQKSIFEWARFTRTRGGEQRLRARFQNPPDGLDAIRATQDAVRFLMEHAERFDTLLDGSNWLSIERYLRSSHGLAHGRGALLRSLDGAWHTLRNGDALAQVRIGLATLQRQTHAARALADEVRPLSPPALVREWLESVEAALAGPALSRLEGKDVHRRSAGAALGIDGALRERECRDALELARLAYEIDALCSMARATREHRLVFPEFLPGPGAVLEIDGVYHPFVKGAVRNPVSLSPGARLLFITGPNMAGKSTYMKAAGVAVFLAHLGMGVPAASMRLTAFDLLFSGINTTDSVSSGESYFFREVRRVKQLAQLLGKARSAVVIFDEMFKGTNLKDATDACVAVLSGLVASEESRFLVASHIAELGDPLAELGCVGFTHFAAALDGGRATFEFRLRPGISTQRLGMHILEQERVLQLLRDLAPGAAPG
jgi:DNA mismatch repair ATPase MutS